MGSAFFIAKNHRVQHSDTCKPNTTIGNEASNFVKSNEHGIAPMGKNLIYWINHVTLSGFFWVVFGSWNKPLLNKIDPNYRYIVWGLH